MNFSSAPKQQQVANILSNQVQRNLPVWFFSSKIWTT